MFIVPRILALLSVGVLGFVPPTGFLLEKMADMRAEQALTQFKVSFQCGGPEGEPHLETLTIKTGGWVRHERGGSQVDLCARGSCKRTGASGPGAREVWPYPGWTYFSEGLRDGEGYAKWLKGLQVDLKVNTMARFRGKIAYLFGAKEGELDRPQFWLDKDSFLPLRLLFREGSVLIDIAWIGWGGRVAGNWFPETIELSRDGKLVERCEVTLIESGAKIGPETFQR